MPLISFKNFFVEMQRCAKMMRPPLKFLSREKATGADCNKPSGWMNVTTMLYDNDAVLANIAKPVQPGGQMEADHGQDIDTFQQPPTSGE
jgi:hypothetical protein